MWKIEFQLLFQFLSENYTLIGLPPVLDMPKPLFSLEEDYIALESRDSHWPGPHGTHAHSGCLQVPLTEEVGPLHNPATPCDCTTTFRLMSFLARMPSH